MLGGLSGPGLPPYRAGMLVGRDAEQRQLDQLLAQSRAGTGAVLLLRGIRASGRRRCFTMPPAAPRP
jgi:hypothetical protein